MITTEGLLEAYYDCRKRKRKTASAIMYEINYESKLIELRDRVNNRTYQPGKSICFIVTRPRIGKYSPLLSRIELYTTG